MTHVHWFPNAQVADAIDCARELRRPLLVDFWSPTCLGCAKHVAVTYESAAVRQFLRDSFLCVRYNTKQPDDHFRTLTGSSAHLWHPVLVVLDYQLKELRRVAGYLTPDELIAQLSVGIALGHLHHQRPGDALALAERVAGEYPRSGAAPEALYWAGVAAYRAGGGLPALAARWNAIAARYPTSDWALRADCLDVEIPDEGFDDADPSSVRLVEAPAHAPAA